MQNEARGPAQWSGGRGSALSLGGCGFNPRLMMWEKWLLFFPMPCFGGHKVKWQQCVGAAALHDDEVGRAGVLLQQLVQPDLPVGLRWEQSNSWCEIHLGRASNSKVNAAEWRPEAEEGPWCGTTPARCQ